MRIMDLKADGINFNAANGAISNGTVENSFLRNTQDDGVAMWAENAADTNITVNQNTIISRGLANNIAIYGAGQGDVISNNLLEDPVTRGSCIHDGLRFPAVATSGLSSQASATPASPSGALIQIDAGGAASSPFVADTDFNNGNEFSTTATVARLEWRMPRRKPSTSLCAGHRPSPTSSPDLHQEPAVPFACILQN